MHVYTAVGSLYSSGPPSPASRYHRRHCRRFRSKCTLIIPAHSSTYARTQRPSSITPAKHCYISFIFILFFFFYSALFATCHRRGCFTELFRSQYNQIICILPTSNTWCHCRNMFDCCDPIPKRHRFYPLNLAIQEWLVLWGNHLSIHSN